MDSTRAAIFPAKWLCCKNVGGDWQVSLRRFMCFSQQHRLQT
jgi:hypothetical protein